MHEYKGRLMNERVTAFFVPGLLATLSITASMFLDIAIVGRMLGSVAMGAISLALPITMMFNMIYMLLGTGSEVLISAAKGSGNKLEANKLFSVTLFTILSISGLIMLVGLLGYTAPFASALSEGDREMQTLLTSYIRIMFIAAPCLIGVTSMSYFVKVDALPKLAAGIMVFANVINIISKIFYMGPLHLGIEGAAYGTITGFVAGFLLMVPYLFFKKNRTLEFTAISLKDFKRLGNVIITGLPSSLGQGLGAITTFCVNTVILDVIGKNGIIINTVCSSLTIFISSFRYAATSTMVPLVGALFGERDWWSMHQVAIRTTKIVLTCVTVSILIIELFPAELLRFFGVHDMYVLSSGTTALRIYAISLFPGSLIHIIMTYMQTISRKIFSIAISIGTELFAMVCIYLFGSWFGPLGLWSYSIAAYMVLLLLITLATKYICKKSNGKYHGFFIHEIQPSYVIGHSIYSTEKAATEYAEIIGTFLDEHHLSASIIADIKKLVQQQLIEIIKDTKNAQKTIDIMALIYDNTIMIRLRDDNKNFNNLTQESDKRIRRLSVMGYNNTYVEVSINK